MLIYSRTDVAVELIEDIIVSYKKYNLDFHDLQAHLNKRVEASDVQPPIVVDTDQFIEHKENIMDYKSEL